MRVEELVVPGADHEIFEADADALLIKPYMTGDIFVGVKDDDEEEVAVAIAGHPCVIRGSGGRLMTRVPCCLLKPMDRALSYEQWPDGHFDKFPIPDSAGLGTNQAVRLLEWRSVHRRQLTRARRKLALTERGVYVFQQRFTHAITRVAVPLAAYEAASRHVLREAGLEEEWVGELVSNPTDEKAIDQRVKELHAFLDAPEGSGTRRALLRLEGGEQRLTKMLREEIRRQTPPGSVQ